jgi:hypothetical protein
MPISIRLQLGICERAMVVLNREDMSRQIRSLRHRADEVRAACEDMHNTEARRSLLLIAASYDTMAHRLEATAAHLSLARTG